MVHGEEKLKISDEVIAVCAVNATLKTEGVARLAGGFSNTLSKNLLGKELMSKGIKVSQSDDGVQIDVFIIVKYQVKIPAVAWDIQENVKKEVSKLVGENVQISVVEVKNPDLVAQLVADNIAHSIENRVSFRVAQKKAIRNTMKAGAKGIKTLVSGRLGGADIARGEGYSEGTTPLHTLRANIDYATSEADTTYGKIGVKVWIYKGEILEDNKKAKGGN